MDVLFVLIYLLSLKDIGEREGKYYAINIPLKDGIDDTSFTRLFKTVGSLYCIPFLLLLSLFLVPSSHVSLSCRLLPRLLRHICLVLLFFNVGLIHWQGTVWAASISPLKVLQFLTVYIPRVSKIISYACLICLDELLVCHLWEWESLCP